MDPNDELAVLRTAMNEDPESDVKVLLDAWMEDDNMHYLHIGIKYGWGEGEASSVSSKHGQLVIVKNRLRPEYLPWEEVKVQPLLRQDEIAGRPCREDELIVKDQEFDEEAFEDLYQTDLGGLGCCDCCHSHCNVGQK